MTSFVFTKSLKHTIPKKTLYNYYIHMRSKNSYIKNIFSRFAQILYLTISNFSKNAMWESASACAFGFIFSFIPITMIIFTVLVGIIQVYPNIYNFIIGFANEIQSVVNILPFLDKLMTIRSASSFNIFLSVWIIWMARKLFNSIIIAMNKVFRSVSKRKSWFNQLLTFIVEFAITLLIAVILIAAFAFTQIISLPFFQNILSSFPILFKQSSHNIGVLILYFILFVSTVLAYRIVSGTKPLFRRCIFYAFLSTVSFFIVSSFINLFMNVTNYNAVYGTISSLVLLMMKVYLFFIIFLFCAQMIYVSQFFETLLRSEIYQLPGYESKGFGNYLRRFLFINPSEIQTELNTVYLKSGETLYRKDQSVSFIYYIKSGAINEISEKGNTLRSQGSFIGDVQCILNLNYQSDAVALSDCELISFTSEEFMRIINKSTHAAKKALSKVSEYTAATYPE